MKTEDLFIKKSDCCGCELCSQSCPKQIITMTPDEEGFLYPIIGEEANCISCGRCVSVCPNKSPGRQPVEIQNSFSFSLSEENDLKRSASGGLATAISREFVNKCGIVYGVAYTDNFRGVKYLRATSIEELEPFRGSKYVQAIKGDVYKRVRLDLNSGLKVLFIGLPCEVSAMYHAVSKIDNLYTISLICHGPTSQKVHRDFCDSLPNAKTTISSFSVRYKLKGWKPYYVHAEYVDGAEHNEEWNTSDYGMAFLYLKRPSCTTCRYKAGDTDFGLQSDMTVGDFHGVNKHSKQYNPWGVSQVCVQTDKGDYLASLLPPSTITEIPNTVIEVTNRGLFMAIPQRGNRQKFVDDYLGRSLHYACHSPMVLRTNKRIKLETRLSRIVGVVKNPSKILRRIKNSLSIKK